MRNAARSALYAMIIIGCGGAQGGDGRNGSGGREAPMPEDVIVGEMTPNGGTTVPIYRVQALSGAAMSSDRGPIWPPPETPECDVFEACCVEGVEIDRSVGTMCQLTMSNGDSCTEARATIVRHLRGRGQPVPTWCTR